MFGSKTGVGLLKICYIILKFHLSSLYVFMHTRYIDVCVCVQKRIMDYVSLAILTISM